MPIVVDVRDENVDADTLERIFDWLRFVDAVFSTYKDDSEISRLNRGELTLEDVHPDLAEVLTRCDELRAETDGYFDVSAAAAERIDPSGLVKGWAVDRAAALLDAAGLRDYAVNAGGDMLLRGGALPEPRCASESSIRSSPTGSLPFSRSAIWPWPRRVPTPAASTSWIHTRAGPRRASSP